MATQEHAVRLAPCPRRPNCVSTEADDARHAIRPYRFFGGAEAARAALKEAMAAEPRCRLVAEEGPYLRYECESRWLRFVDDVEFVVDADAARIRFRSAARTGYSDLGVNRRRMERLRRRLHGRL